MTNVSRLFKKKKREKIVLFREAGEDYATISWPGLSRGEQIRNDETRLVSSGDRSTPAALHKEKCIALCGKQFNERAIVTLHRAPLLLHSFTRTGPFINSLHEEHEDFSLADLFLCFTRIPVYQASIVAGFLKVSNFFFYFSPLEISFS